MFVTWQQTLLFVSMFFPWAGKEGTKILFFGAWSSSRPPAWRSRWRLVICQWPCRYIHLIKRKWKLFSYFIWDCVIYQNLVQIHQSKTWIKFVPNTKKMHHPNWPQERARLLGLTQRALNEGNTNAVVFVTGDQVGEYKYNCFEGSQ